MSGEFRRITQRMRPSQRYSQKDISVAKFIVDQPGLSNKQFRLWLASQSQSNLIRWAEAR